MVKEELIPIYVTGRDDNSEIYCRDIIVNC